MNGLADCCVSTIGKPHEYFDLTTSNPKRPSARVLNSFVFLDTTPFRRSCQQATTCAAAQTLYSAQSPACPPYCLSFGNIRRARSMRWRSMSWNAASRLRSSMCSVIAERITCEIG